MRLRWWLYPLLLLVSLVLVALGVATLMVVLLFPSLPSLEALTDYRPRMPLYVYASDGELMAEFGEERRSVVSIKDVPETLKQAIIAAEDERFYQHRGVDYVAIARAVIAQLTGGKRQGGGTITMQLARDFYLERKFSPIRKLTEALLAIKIERNLSKDQILELYINQIFLGQRAYGFAAGANTYFGKQLKDLTLAESALLAGILPAPSRYNPFVGNSWQPRQKYVLTRMKDLGFIDEAKQKQALAEVIKLNPSSRERYALEGDYVAEMARQFAQEQFGEAALVSGLKVYTTIKKRDQDAANAALRRGVLEYDRRHGYRGPEAFTNLPAGAVAEDSLDELLQERETINQLIPAIVLEASPQKVTVYTKGGESITITGDGLKFAAKYLSDRNLPDRIRRGALVRVSQEEKGWAILQLPKVEAAFVSLDPADGAIVSLVGGFDFDVNKFNHVTQAQRQPGSSFKPFIYSAALEKGFTPASIINDAPITVEADKTGSGEVWEPKNYDGKYDGPMRLRTALAKSKNMVSVRIMQSIGPKYAQDYALRFGFSEKDVPPVLALALGSGSATPLQMASAYAVFANGGYKIKPYFVRRVVDARGQVLYSAQPELAGTNAERVIDERNAFIMTSIMKDVISYGTATRALTLNRRDLAGKTGTTNDHFDAWFAGFHPRLVGVSWIGFDNPADLGNEETGGRAALPIWVGYMGRALKEVPQMEPKPPAGLTTLMVNAETGERADAGGKIEWFYQENAPRMIDAIPRDARPSEEIKSQIF